MKKQKFTPYQEPIFRKFITPTRTENISNISNKTRKRQIINCKSQHKKNQHLIPQQQLQNNYPFRSSEIDDFQIIQNSNKLFHVNMPKQIFLNKIFDPAHEHTSLRKINNLFESQHKLATSQDKKTINSSSKQSTKKINTSALLPRKDFKQLKLKNFTDSPYLKNISDITKLVKMLKPVKGPNESIKKQIVQYNDLNKKNHQLVVLRRPNQTFQAKRRMYLERIGYKSDSKVFIMNSRDQHIRQALINRGWIQLHDISDSFYHLKWVYSDSANDYTNLNRGQFFNHFYNNQQLTNKNSLRKNIKSVSQKNRPQAPITFDFGIAQQFKRFVQNATLFEGLKILNLIKNNLQQYDSWTYKRIISNPNYFKFQNKQILTPRNKGKVQLINLINSLNYNNQINFELLIQNTIQLISFLVKQLQKLGTIKYSLFTSQSYNQKYFNILPIFQYFQTIIKSSQCQQTLTLIPKFLKVQLIKLYFHFFNSKTFYKKSYGTQNSWIVKPTGVSRGSGIYIESDYKKLLSQTNNQHGKIVQKYIQRPFLLKDKRKFDLRQWVLVKSFQPLQVYMFSKLYGRICPQKYEENDFQNIQKHLTNYSLSKDFYKSKNGSHPNILSSQQNSILFNHVGMKKVPPSSIILEDDLIRQIEQSGLDKLNKNKQNNNKNKSWKQIKLQIKKSIIRTLKACSNGIEQNGSSFEVYGFDILLDDDLNVFIIQVNLSPACQNRQGLDVYLDSMSNGLVILVQNWLNIGYNKIRKSVQISNKSRQKMQQQIKNKINKLEVQQQQINNKNKNKQKKQQQLIWQRLNEQEIQEQLRQINEQKIKQQKATLIKKWIKYKLLINKK